MTTFADAIEIDPSAISSVSGGNRMINLSHDATVGGIANVKELESMDLGGGPMGDGGPPPATEYEAVVDNGPGHANHYVHLTESQYNADIHDVYQTNNVASDFSSPDPGNSNNPAPAPTGAENVYTFTNEVSDIDGFSNVRAISDMDPNGLMMNSSAEKYSASVDDGQGNLTQVNLTVDQYNELMYDGYEQNGISGVNETRVTF